MNSQTALSIRMITPADLADADELRRLAGWNQTLTDWLRFLRCEPNGCFVAHYGNAVVGTATTICYGKELGWIGMLLVHPDHRRSGIGSALLRRAIDYLRTQGARSIKLDATPLGEPLYVRHGFQSELSLTRWQRAGREIGSAEELPEAPAPVSETELAAIVALDAATFGLPRSLLFRELLAQRPRIITRPPNRNAQAYGLLRAGARSFYLGPVVATEPGGAAQVIGELLAQIPDQAVYWDVLDGNASAAGLARQLGFTPQRPLLRMFHGENFKLAQPLWQFALVDPAVG